MNEHDSITVRAVGVNEAAACVEALADILLDCVEGGASVGFMWPLPRERALAFWRKIAEGVANKERILLIAETAQGEIVGTVQVITSQPDNQPHRADIAKMLVHRKARRQGIAQRLMDAAHDAARHADKTVLVLDTVTGGDAERLYQRAGWQRVGDIPNYALMPDGRMCSTTYYTRQLAPMVID